jgi:hypothetical protein
MRQRKKKIRTSKGTVSFASVDGIVTSWRRITPMKIARIPPNLTTDPCPTRYILVDRYDFRM